MASLYPLTTIPIIVLTLRMLLNLPNSYTTEVLSENINILFQIYACETIHVVKLACVFIFLDLFSQFL